MFDGAFAAKCVDENTSMKLAIVKLSALGDIVHAMVALQFVKRQDSRVEIDWLVERRFAGILEDNPHIRRILTVDIKAVKHNKRGFFAQFKQLLNYRRHHYDCVVDAQGLIKSAVAGRILASNMIGFDGNSIRERPASLFYRQTVACPYDVNSIDRNVKVIARALNFSVDRDEILEKEAFLFYRPPDDRLQDFLQAPSPKILFVVGSSWLSKNYPKEKFLNVVNGLTGSRWIVWGNAEEKNMAEWIAQRSDARVLPSLDLNHLKAAVAGADLVIGNDTGPTHMAWALNRPSITLFGPTPVIRTYQTSINKVLKSPSLVNPFKLNKNDFSIKQIDENAIIEVADSLLK